MSSFSWQICCLSRVSWFLGDIGSNFGKYIYNSVGNIEPESESKNYSELILCGTKSDIRLGFFC